MKNHCYIVLIFFCFAKTAFAQSEQKKFWAQNQAATAYVWDQVAAGNANGEINNGLGNWDFVTRNWTVNGGKTNTLWHNCADAYFGGNTGVSNAGVVTLIKPIKADSLSFRPATGGNFTIAASSTANTLTPCKSYSPIHVDALLTPTITAIIAGVNRGITKWGDGKLILNATNTFTGVTRVSKGILQVGNAGTTGDLAAASNVIVDDLATMIWDNNNSTSLINISNIISGSGTVIMQGQNSDATKSYTTYRFLNDNPGFTGNWILNGSRLYTANVLNPYGTAKIEIQSLGQILPVGTNMNVTNEITIQQDAGWWDNGFVLGAIRPQGTVNFTGNFILNDVSEIVLGDGTGLHNTMSPWTTSEVSINNVISGNGGFKMGRFTSWNGGSTQNVNIYFEGTNSNTYLGTTVVDGQGAKATLWGNKTGGAIAFLGNIQMGSQTGGQANLRMGYDNQFGAGSVMNFVNANGQWMRFDLNGTTQTLAGITGGDCNTRAGAVIQNEAINYTSPATNGTLILNGTGDYLYNGYMRDQDNSGTTKKLNLLWQGTGTQTLVGNVLYYTGFTQVDAGTLRIGCSGVATDINDSSKIVVANDALLEIAGTSNNVFSYTADFEVAGLINVINSATAHTITGNIIMNNGEFSSTTDNSTWGSYTANGASMTANGGQNVISALGWSLQAGGLTVNTPIATDTIHWNGPVRNANNVSTGVFTKNGDGRINMNGNSTYGGNTVINGGEWVQYGTNNSGLFTMNNDARISVDTVVNTLKNLTFTGNTSGINVYADANKDVTGVIYTDVVNWDNPIVVDVLEPMNPQTYLFMKTTTTANPSFVLGINNSGYSNLRIETRGTYCYLAFDWGTLYDIYDSERENITYQMQSPLTGNAGLSYALTSGALPPGLSMSPNGLITGTATATTADIVYSFTIQATAGSDTSINSFTWKVKAPITQILTASINFQIPPGYSDLFRAYVLTVGGGGGGRSQSYGDGGGGGQVVEGMLSAPVGVFAYATVGQGGGQNVTGGNSSFGIYQIATGGIRAFGTGGAEGGSNGGRSNGQAGTLPGNGGESGVLVNVTFRALLATHFGIPETSVRLGAGGGGGRWFGSGGGGGFYGGGRGASNSRGQQATAGIDGTGGGGGGSGANSYAGRSGGDGILVIRY